MRWISLTIPITDVVEDFSDGEAFAELLSELHRRYDGRLDRWADDVANEESEASRAVVAALTKAHFGSSESTP